MAKERTMKVEELALAVGVSVKTINNWYAFKQAEPDNELAKLLPEFQQEHPRATRTWKFSDIWRVKDFQSRIITGRNGHMGVITQKYVKKGE
jgi:hypothetical protein